MIVTAWILFIFFGFFFLVSTGALFDRKIKSFNLYMYFFYVFMTAIMAGVIWGGLFQ